MAKKEDGLQVLVQMTDQNRIKIKNPQCYGREDMVQEQKQCNKDNWITTQWKTLLLRTLHWITALCKPLVLHTLHWITVEHKMLSLLHTDTQDQLLKGRPAFQLWLGTVCMLFTMPFENDAVRGSFHRNFVRVIFFFFFLKNQAFPL